jgi:carbohydrate-binding DOMON domain-containing protein
MSLPDPANDDHGLAGNYTPPQHAQSIGQLDILKVSARLGGDILELELTMRELTNDWLPPYGFDNVAFSIFIDAIAGQGKSILPMINTSMPADWQWDMAHVVYGWGNTTYSTEGASGSSKGRKFGIAPQVEVDSDNKLIRFRYRKTDFGITEWSGAKFFITTWDITGEGAYRDLSPVATKWSFGGGESDGPKVLDSVQFTIPGK